jgi:hypothetical protein
MYADGYLDNDGLDLAHQYDHLRARRIHYKHVVTSYSRYGYRAMILEWVSELYRGWVHDVGNALHSIQARIGELTYDFPEFGNFQGITRAQAVCQCCGWRLYTLTEIASSPVLLARPVDLPVWLDEILRILESCCPAGVNLCFDARMESAIVHNYDNQLQLAFARVIFNAFESSSRVEDGRVFVLLENLDDDIVSVSIRDNGPHLLTKEPGGDFDVHLMIENHLYGLGLTISRRIIEKHYGRLSLNASSSMGTVVTFELPLGDPEPDWEDEEGLIIALESLNDEVMAYKKEINVIKGKFDIPEERYSAELLSVFEAVGRAVVDSIMSGLNCIRQEVMPFLESSDEEVSNKVVTILKGCDCCELLLNAEYWRKPILNICEV